MNASTLSEISALWTRVLNELSKQINDNRIFDVFFKDTYIYSIDGKEMIVDDLSFGLIEDAKKIYENVIPELMKS